MRLLEAEGVEAVVLRLVVERAHERLMDEHTALLKAMEVVVQNGVARAFGAR